MSYGDHPDAPAGRAMMGPALGRALANPEVPFCNDVPEGLQTLRDKAITTVFREGYREELIKALTNLGLDLRPDSEGFLRFTGAVLIHPHSRQDVVFHFALPDGSAKQLSVAKATFAFSR